ncbi:hypothetical protein LIER_34570 [Lithospermum erythrorhizon]|uniref:RNA-binding protein AU-1/Ribonuclease E/G domain-containing protein n=1 Tax=Lithospermum erythrorhizon TaxID=34254 RepID=A0AAV3S1A2_LITER
MNCEMVVDLVIEQTEALVSIDVNGGHCMLGQGTSQEKAILDVNLAAAKQIARELRLRDIDMMDEGKWRNNSISFYNCLCVFASLVTNDADGTVELQCKRSSSSVCTISGSSTVDNFLSSVLFLLSLLSLSSCK